MNTNKISAVFSSADQTTAAGHVTALNTLLTFLQGLTMDQRKRLNKAANARTPFVQQAYLYAQQHPAVLPGMFDLAEFGKDVDLITGLQAYAALLTTHFEKVRDTFSLVNSDGYEQALEVYNSFKRAKKNGEYDSIVTALGAFFASQGHRPAPPTP